MSNRLYILYDGRAMLDGTEEASVLVANDFENPAIALRWAEKKWFKYEWAMFSYKTTDKDELVDEQFEYYHAPYQKPYYEGKKGKRRYKAKLKAKKPVDAIVDV